MPRVIIKLLSAGRKMVTAIGKPGEDVRKLFPFLVKLATAGIRWVNEGCKFYESVYGLAGNNYPFFRQKFQPSGRVRQPSGENLRSSHGEKQPSDEDIRSQKMLRQPSDGNYQPYDHFQQLSDENLRS